MASQKNVRANAYWGHIMKEEVYILRGDQSDRFRSGHKAWTCLCAHGFSSYLSPMIHVDHEDKIAHQSLP